MLSKRVIVCLDVRNGRLTKGIRFAQNIDIGDPVALAKRYSEEGADEIVFYDITASAEARGIFLDVVTEVAKQIFIPFTVGGGIDTLDAMHSVLDAGAEKISINSAAVKRPSLITEGAKAFGSQAIVVGMDVLRVPKSAQIPSGYEIVIHGGRIKTGQCALAWAKECEDRGCGEICANSIDCDGTQNGYDIALMEALAQTVHVPLIASGGCGHPKHMAEVVKHGAQAALIASIVHYGTFTIKACKDIMAGEGVCVRMPW
ncbi:MAG: imidazole glycerol phosphate synthase subunit HisF [Desulfovibrio sp.]|nr:imidazole glycerol phosphate synthase subunit HisF [Desulfovibrio sp.]